MSVCVRVCVYVCVCVCVSVCVCVCVCVCVSVGLLTISTVQTGTHSFTVQCTYHAHVSHKPPKSVDSIEMEVTGPSLSPPAVVACTLTL